MKQVHEEKRIFCYHNVLNNGVTGSCHVLDFKFANDEHHIFLADVGLFLGGETETTKEGRRNEDMMNNMCFPLEMDEIEGIMISHCHTDHIGRLPMLVHLGYEGPIYVSYATAVLLKNALSDCYRCTKRIYQNLYDEGDVEKTLQLLKVVDFNRTFNVLDDGENKIDLTFFMNGHLLGSANMLFRAKERDTKGLNIFYIGDYKKDNIFFDVKFIPKWVYNLPINLIVESTYGTSDSTDIEYTFQNNVARAAKRGGTIIIPVIALERTEIVLYNLKCMQQNKILDTNIPIFLVGKLASKYLKVYQSTSTRRKKLGLKEGMANFVPRNFSVVSGQNVNELLWSKKQMIVLATPGMMAQGNSYNFIMKHIENGRDLIQITSYVASDFGNKILNAKKGENLKFLSGQRLNVRAEIKQSVEFSAHAKRDELYNDVIRKFKNIVCLTIVHGEPNVRKSFAEYVRKQPDFPNVPIVIGNRNKKIRYSADESPKVIGCRLKNVVSLTTSRRRKKKEKTYKHRNW